MQTSSPSSITSSTADWERTQYAWATKKQMELVAQRNNGEITDTLIFTEHEPVFTLGVRRGAKQNLLWPAPELARRGIEIRTTSRGGDITYHGPGQLVGYPIINLSPRKDLHAYLRFLEQVIIDTVAHYNLNADRNPGKTGIWLSARKIAAIGVAVKKWTTFHGFALNVNTDLTPFSGIVPCGISTAEGSVTSMHLELGCTISFEKIKDCLSNEFWRQLPDFFSGLDRS